MEEFCRGCEQKLPIDTWLELPNMPKRAQFFPDKKELKDDKGMNFALKQCPYCGLIQAIGEPVFYYKDVIRAAGVSDEMFSYRKKQFQSWVAHYKLSGKKILEIGCGKGFFMRAMEQTGVIVYGLEHNKDAVNAGNEEGRKIIRGFIENEQYQIPGAPYDGFYCIQFLEHIPKPANFLRGIANNLVDGGIGILEVPNFEKALEKAEYAEFIQDHLLYFTKNSLCNLLERNGFEVLYSESIMQDIILSLIVRKRVPYSAKEFKDTLDKRKLSMRRFLEIRVKQKKKIAVWGASHISLTEISLLDMKDKISCILDSAEFKQNKYAPVTHIPILSPTYLEKGEIQTVIIMAGVYSQEVKKIMERDYPQIEGVIWAQGEFVYEV